MRTLLLLLVMTSFGLFTSCKAKKSEETKKESIEELNVYTHRHYKADKELFNAFQTETGIKVNVINAKADELILKIENEGEQSPADVLITVDAGRLVKAKNKNLLQSIDSEILDKNIPKHLRDQDKQWFALTKRARVIAYVKSRTSASQLSTYEALISPEWGNKILVRSSANIYNQSLLASIIANQGKERAEAWVQGMVKNMARSPKGNDRDQVKTIVAGEGDLAIINTYYMGKLLNSKNPNEVEVAKQVALFFPNQEGRGTHINISGAAVLKYAPNKENAVKFIEFLSGEKAQKVFSSANYEYPANPKVEASDLLKSWGAFKEDTLNLSELGKRNKEAVLMFDAFSWK